MTMGHCAKAMHHHRCRSSGCTDVHRLEQQTTKRTIHPCPKVLETSWKSPGTHSGQSRQRPRNQDLDQKPRTQRTQERSIAPSSSPSSHLLDLGHIGGHKIPCRPIVNTENPVPVASVDNNVRVNLSCLGLMSKLKLEPCADNERHRPFVLRLHLLEIDRSCRLDIACSVEQGLLCRVAISDRVLPGCPNDVERLTTANLRIIQDHGYIRHQHGDHSYSMAYVMELRS